MEIKWKQVGYIRQGESLNYDYYLWLNEPLASWDVWDYWERERIESMRSHLTKNDILFDVGTESGWCNLVYAEMVGPKNMVLVEPTAEFWPNIKALWEKNYPNVKPLACYVGFFSDKTTEKKVDLHDEFPPASDGELIDKNAYKYIHEHGNVIPQITIDDYVKASGIKPTALTIDTEGSELLVLQGAKNLLSKHPIKVWVSEHDDLAERDYGVKEDEVANFMQKLGYSREVLGVDHERHVYYYKNDK